MSRRPSRPPTKRQRLGAFLRDVFDRASDGHLFADPFLGVPPALERVLLYSGDDQGHRFGPRVDGQMKCRDGWTSAHAGTVGDPQESDEERLIRGAQLTAEEAAVWRLRHGEERSRADTAIALGLSVSQVDHRAATARAKVESVARVVRAMDGGGE